MTLQHLALDQVPAVRITGSVAEVTGPIIKAHLPGAAIGDVAEIDLRDGKGIVSQVVGFNSSFVLLSPFQETQGIFPGALVSLRGKAPRLQLGSHLLGTTVDSLGKPLLEATAGQEPLPRGSFPRCYDSIQHQPPSPLQRRPIVSALDTGVRALDAFIPIGKGQRLAILAEPGVGKSTLLAMLARRSRAEINVFGLIGERGREVQELLFETLDAETRARSVVVVSTSDEAALSRLTAAYTATRIAEYFRDNGCDVLLQIDSLTRLFRAYREVGLARGEVPVRRGYPPSVFAELPRLIERAGTSAAGSITALYTVLLSSDVDEDPMVDEVKGLTDGHILLRRSLAEQGHYPAIDVLGSISRLAPKIVPREVLRAATLVRRLLARLHKDRDLLLLGGSADPELACALHFEPEILALLQQEVHSHTNQEATHQHLLCLAQQIAEQLSDIGEAPLPPDNG